MDSILIVEDDEQLASTFQRFLKRAGYLVVVAGEYNQGKKLLTSGSYSVIFMDINLPGNLTGIDLLKEIREINLDTPVVIMTGAPEVSTAAEAVRNAAFDYLCKPIEKEQLLKVAKAAVEHKNSSDEKKRQVQNLEAAFKSVKDALGMVDLDTQKSAKTPANQPFSSDQPNLETSLSEQERLILSLLGKGESSSDIAAVLFISARTVESYYARIISKLNLEGMKELRRYAIKNQ